MRPLSYVETGMSARTRRVTDDDLRCGHGGRLDRGNGPRAWRGITWQLASIGSLVLGYLFAYPIREIAPMLPGPPETTRAMSMAAAYAVVSGAVFAAAWMVPARFALKFEAFDRHLGMMLGGLEGGVRILATLLIVSVSPNTRGPIFASPTGRVVGSVMNTLGPVLPGEVRKILEPFWEVRGASVQTIANDDSTVAESTPEVQAQAGLAPLTLPTLEPIPVRDASVQPVSSPASASPNGHNAVAETPNAADEPESPSARSMFDAVVERGKQKAEQFVAESLDTDTDQKAASLRELVDKDKTRIQNAVSDVVSGTKQSLTNQVTEAVDDTKANLTSQVAETVGATKQNLTNQLQGKAGQLQGKAKEARAESIKPEVRSARPSSRSTGLVRNSTKALTARSARGKNKSSRKSATQSTSS